MTPMVKVTDSFGNVSYIRFEAGKLRLTGSDGTPLALCNIAKDEVMFAETVKAKKPADSHALLAISRTFMQHRTTKLEAVVIEAAVDGPWEMSGPEGDDGDDTVVICNSDAPEYEVITITEGDVEERKDIGRQIADLLNRGKAVLA